MSDLEDSFLQAIARQPHDWLPRLIFADWLEEQGDPRGELIRLSHQLNRLECEDRQRKEARLQKLVWREEKAHAARRRKKKQVDWPSPSLSNSLNLKFVLIPPGQFRMGSPPEEAGRNSNETQVQVTLTQGFWLGQCVVTQREWKKVMVTKPWNIKASFEGNSNPAILVSWDDARDFCAKLTATGHQEGWLGPDWRCDLPTEAQWEYACRAGTTTRFCFGNADHNDKQRLWEYAWFDMNAWANNADEIDYYYPRPVGQHKPNSWGLCDMHGGVHEWCRDWYVARLPGGTDPEVQEPMENAYRVNRGGSWLDEEVSDCRSAIRGCSSPDHSSATVGFRVAVVQCR